MNTDIQHILVVEDEAAHAEAISRILENSLTPGLVRVTVVSTLEAYRHQISIHSKERHRFPGKNHVPFPGPGHPAWCCWLKMK